jgi:hypothetical protein
MLVPLTDSTNPYAAMMLELISDQRARTTSVRRTSSVPGTSRRWEGIRSQIGRFRARRGQASASKAA